MARKYAILGFVLVQSLVIVGMDQSKQNESPLKSSSEALSRSGGLSQSQELSKKIKQTAASYYASPCSPIAKLKDLEHDWKPLPQDYFHDCP